MRCSSLTRHAIYSLLCLSRPPVLCDFIGHSFLHSHNCIVHVHCSHTWPVRFSNSLSSSSKLPSMGLVLADDASASGSFRQTQALYCGTADCCQYIAMLFVPSVVPSVNSDICYIHLMLVLVQMSFS